LKRDECF
jgi:hypothetical protein